MNLLTKCKIKFQSVISMESKSDPFEWLGSNACLASTEKPLASASKISGMKSNAFPILHDFQMQLIILCCSILWTAEWWLWEKVGKGTMSPPLALPSQGNTVPHSSSWGERWGNMIWLYKYRFKVGNGCNPVISHNQIRPTESNVTYGEVGLSNSHWFNGPALVEKYYLISNVVLTHSVLSKLHTVRFFVKLCPLIINFCFV